MNYFVTGATGFIGRNLVERLLQREGTIYALVRAGSRGRLEELRTS
jgi:thioester reductase-like protein